MIFTQEAPLTRKWSSGRSCIRSNRNNLGVNFEEGGNLRARRKPSKSCWDRLKLNPHTTFVVEVKGVIDAHYASLTSQGVQHRVFYLDGHPSRYQPRPTVLIFITKTTHLDSPWRRGWSELGNGLAYSITPIFLAFVHEKFKQYTRWTPVCFVKENIKFSWIFFTFIHEYITTMTRKNRWTKDWLTCCFISILFGKNKPTPSLHVPLGEARRQHTRYKTAQVFQCFFFVGRDHGIKSSKIIR